MPSSTARRYAPRDLGDWLSASQAARILGITVTRFHQISSEIGSFPVATGRLYDPADVEALRQKREG
jgi:hypothetical protein